MVGGRAVARDAVRRQAHPYGLFAIAATAAGTLDVEQLGRLQIYLLTYVAVASLLSLWVLPGLVAALTPIPLGALLRTSHATPLHHRLCRRRSVHRAAVAHRREQDAGAPLRRPGVEAATLPDVIVPASFNFPHTGKLLSLSFVLFAGWFADAVVPVSRYAQLAASGSSRSSAASTPRCRSSSTCFASPPTRSSSFSPPV